VGNRPGHRGNDVWIDLPAGTIEDAGDPAHAV
jgi:hypothetical protein